MMRYQRKPKPKLFDLWHPIEHIGDVGAAIGPLVLGVALHAGQKGYGIGPTVLCTFGNDNGERAAAVVTVPREMAVMSTVYANGMEVSAKKDANKSLAAMPDVCLSPPSPPAGPIPIPYPNFANASDTSSGSKTVKIRGEEVGLKNNSNYKQSKGDEAATRGLGMGVVTHTIQGKLKHTAWSFDVKVEDKNVVRHMDITTHNHMNCPNIALTLNQAGMNLATINPLPCEELEAANASMRAQGAGGNALRPSAGTRVDHGYDGVIQQPARRPGGEQLHGGGQPSGSRSQSEPAGGGTIASP